MFEWLFGHDFDSVSGIVRFAAAFERAAPGSDHRGYVEKTYDELCSGDEARRKIVIEAMAQIRPGRFSEFYLNGLAKYHQDEALLQVARVLPEHRQQTIYMIEHHYRQHDTMKSRGIEMLSQLAIEYPEHRGGILWCLRVWYGSPVVNV